LKAAFAKILLLLGLFGGSLAMFLSISNPSMPGNARLFGFSYLRLGLMGADLAWLVLIGLVTIRAFRDQGWLENGLERISRLLEDAPEDPDPRANGIEVSKISGKRGWYYEAVLVLLVILIFTPVIYTMVILIPNSDYPSHLYWAQQLQEAVHPDVPPDVIAHSGWQFLVIFFQVITKSPWAISGVLATMLGIVLMALVLFHWIRPALIRQGISLWWGLGIVIALNLVTPVFLVTYLDGRHYFGYLGMSTYHNPTIILLRPFAILQFIYAMRCFQEGSTPWRQVMVAAMFSFLATYIKPVFAICILPALGMLTLYRLYKKQKIDWRLLGLGLVLPTALTLTWQYLLSYYASSSGGIIFAPFSVMRLYSDRLLVKYLLSILFPLCLTIFYFRKAGQDTRLVLGWLTFFASSFFTYFIAESGEFFNSGNFAWSGEISMLVLFCVCTLFFIEQMRANRLKGLVLKFSWLLHVSAGMLYYCYCLLLRSYI
jgi:hypothetical protein